jgi:hypothetical protein
MNYNRTFTNVNRDVIRNNYAIRSIAYEDSVVNPFYVASFPLSENNRRFVLKRDRNYNTLRTNYLVEQIPPTTTGTRLQLSQSFRVNKDKVDSDIYLNNV